MAAGSRTVKIKVHVYKLACRAAALDAIEVATYLESIVMRDAEHIRTRELVERWPRQRPGDLERKAVDDGAASPKVSQGPALPPSVKHAD